MPTPIWADPRYSQFFARAEETIAEAQRLVERPWLGAAEERFHHMILEICGAADEHELAQAS